MSYKFLDLSGLQRFFNKLKALIPVKTSELQNDSGFTTADTALSGTSENAVQNKVVKNALDLKANDSGVVHTTGNESISGTKSFNSDLNLNYASTDVDDIVDSIPGLGTVEDYVHISGAETISGVKTFSDGIVANVSGTATPLSHTHGNLTNDGKIGTTANKPVITGTNGILTAGAFGTSANTFCEGNDSRLSDARTPVSHSHGSISNDGKLANGNKVVITNANKIITESSVTDTELGYLSGVTSAIQTQISTNDSNAVHTTGDESISGTKSFNSDLNLNYANTDVDDIVDSTPGTGTSDIFVHNTGAETISGVKSFPDGIVANVTGSATSATQDGSGNTITSTYGSLTGNNTWSGSNTFSTGGVSGEVGIGTKKFAIVSNTTANYEMTASDFANKVGFFKVATFKENTTSAPRGNTGDYDIISMSINTPFSTYLCTSPRNDILWYGKFWNSVWQGWKEVVNCESTQTITGEKTFQRYVSVYSNILTRGTNPSENAYCTLGFKDSGGNSTARILRWVNSDGYNGLTIECWDAQVTTEKTAYFQLAYDTQGNGYSKLGGVDVVGFIPGTDNSVGLGTTTNRWKTLNGVNPGALSLPDTTREEPIDTTNWVYSYNSPNVYYPPEDGWLAVACSGSDYMQMDGNAGWGITLSKGYDGYCTGIMPVKKNKRVQIRIKETSSGSVVVRKASFYPGTGDPSFTVTPLNNS